MECKESHSPVVRISRPGVCAGIIIGVGEESNIRLFKRQTDSSVDVDGEGKCDARAPFTEDVCSLVTTRARISTTISLRGKKEGKQDSGQNEEMEQATKWNGMDSQNERCVHTITM
ncbi:hypothetical protein CVT25_012986 [Psilocybe cyanescens]|uniref:Uncharacterized protein n=1 Tax=Psilocybe cyanescens TaxID=93625 RepID=A0A409XHL5_PSICY|nr:hypothetical protein CVT25_012986 [Psilocybe cyanescens]